MRDGRRRGGRGLAVALAVLGLQAEGSATEFVRWTDSGFDSAEQRTLADAELYPRGRPDAPYRLNLTVLFARGTPWTQARAIRQIRLTAGILQPCGIALGAVRLARLSLDSSQRRFNAEDADPRTGVPAAVATLASKLPPGSARPAIFLLGRIEGTKSLAVSYRAADEGSPVAPHFDTAWISYPAHWLPRADKHYSPLAHELAHLLCRCGHTPSPTRHLLHASRNYLSSHVLPEHCERFRGSGLLALTH